MDYHKLADRIIMITLMTFFFLLTGTCLGTNENVGPQQMFEEYRSGVRPLNNAFYPGTYPDYNTNVWRVYPWNENPGKPDPWRPYGYFRILDQFEEGYPGGYKYAYDSENQIRVGEQGKVPEYDPNEDIGTSVRGYYEYVGDDGLTHRVDYTSGKQGFRPITTTVIGYPFDPEEIINSFPALDSRFGDGDNTDADWEISSLPHKTLKVPPRNSNLNPRLGSLKPDFLGRPVIQSTSGRPNSFAISPSRQSNGQYPSKNFGTPFAVPSSDLSLGSRFGSVSETKFQPNLRPNQNSYRPLGSSPVIINRPRPNIVGDSRDDFFRPIFKPPSNKNIPPLSSLLRSQNGIIGPESPGLNEFGEQNEQSNIALQILGLNKFGPQNKNTGSQSLGLNGFGTPTGLQYPVINGFGSHNRNSDFQSPKINENNKYIPPNKNTDNQPLKLNKFGPQNKNIGTQAPGLNGFGAPSSLQYPVINGFGSQNSNSDLQSPKINENNEYIPPNKNTDTQSLRLNKFGPQNKNIGTQSPALNAFIPNNRDTGSQRPELNGFESQHRNTGLRNRFESQNRNIGSQSLELNSTPSKPLFEEDSSHTGTSDNFTKSMVGKSDSLPIVPMNDNVSSLSEPVSSNTPLVVPADENIKTLITILQ